MRLTPLRNPYARPRIVSVRRHRGMKKERQERVARFARLGSDPFPGGKGL